MPAQSGYLSISGTRRQTCGTSVGIFERQSGYRISESRLASSRLKNIEELLTLPAFMVSPIHVAEADFMNTFPRSDRIEHPLPRTWIPEFAKRQELFDGMASDDVLSTPPVIVVDGFYQDPVAIRELALAANYVQYAPPLRGIVPDEVFQRVALRNVRGNWMSTALYAFQGQPVTAPVLGFRHNPDSMRVEFERITGDSIKPEDWELGGEWWNGVFHLRDAEHRSGTIHHHHNPGNIPDRGWSGVIYLTPDAPRESGTSFWRSRKTGLCVAPADDLFDYDMASYDKVYLCENVFNRLVLFRESVLHFAEPGFGHDAGRRLTQTFFFKSRARTQPAIR